MTTQLLHDLLVEIASLDERENFLFSLKDSRSIPVRRSHRFTLATTERVSPAARIARKPVHLNTAGKTKRMLTLRVFRRQRAKKRTRTKSELDTSGDATSWTRKILSMPRHWLTTSETPGVLLRLPQSAFSL